MIVLAVPERRQRAHDYWLGGSTALVAGMVNVCAVIAFFAFASNVTGHFAIFAEELAKGHTHQVFAVLGWLLSFFIGAFVANALAMHVADHEPRLGRGIAVVLEICILLGVGYYGHHHYAETLTETEYLVGILLFAMGLQNGLVATVSQGVVKTTHLTGLLTDLGMEFSLLCHRRSRDNPLLLFKLRLHLLILSGYVVGGVAGGLLFLEIGYPTFYAGSFVLAAILSLDLLTATTQPNPADARATHGPPLASSGAVPSVAAKRVASSR